MTKPPTDDEDEDIPRIGLAKKPEEVPKIPRGKLGLAKVPVREIFIIGMTLITLIVVLVMRKSCAAGVGKAFNDFAPPPTPDAGFTYEKAPPLPPEQRPVPATPGR